MVLLAFAGASPAAADQLYSAYLRVLASPDDTEVNLEYAMIAEGQHKWRLALSAYERVLVNDPSNLAARAGLQRVRRIIEPTWTRLHTEAGIAYATNPLHDPANGDPEFYAFGSIRLSDERSLGMTRWRSQVTLYGEGHFEQDDLSTATLYGDTGPVFDIPGTLIALHPAIGGAASYFEGQYAYSEVNGSLTAEGYLDGAMQWARVRSGYRWYAPDPFTSDKGYYVSVDGRLVHKGITGDRDTISVAPWFTYSAIGGFVLDVNSNEVTPGRYTSYGARVEYDLQLTDHISIGPFVDIGQWRYTTDIAPSGDNRRDLLLSPGINLLFRNVLSAQTDLKLTYRYSRNNSNDDAHDYVNQAITLALIRTR